MTSKISSEIKASVLDMYKHGAKKTEIARRCDISPRSVGRIIDSGRKNINRPVPSPAETQSTKTVSLCNATDNKEHSVRVGGNYIVQDEVVEVMKYIRNELKGVEALTYLVESSDSPEHLELYRQILVQKLKIIAEWRTDAGTVKLGIHKTSLNELKTVLDGERGMRY